LNLKSVIGGEEKKDMEIVRMSTCLSFSEVIDIHKPQVEGMRRAVEGFALNDPQACQELSRQVRAVESALMATYCVAAAIAKRAENMIEIAEVWKAMEGFCDLALGVIKTKKGEFPYCSTPELYDLALDYKLACQKRHKGVLEEIECANKEMPKKLFPETI